MAVLVLLETSGATIRSSSLPAVAAARQLAEKRGGPVVGVVIGQGVADAAQDAARYVEKVLAYDDAALAAPLAGSSSRLNAPSNAAQSSCRSGPQGNGFAPGPTHS